MSFLNARVSDETKAAWKALAKAVGRSESELLKQAVNAVLKTTKGVEKSSEFVVSEEDKKGGSIRIALRKHEVDAIERAAAVLGWRRNTWLVSLIRTHLFKEPRPTDAELAALHRSNGELLAIGRNLNQLAHALHRDDRYKDSVSVEKLDQLRETIAGHVASQQAMLEAAENRWQPPDSFRPETSESARDQEPR